MDHKNQYKITDGEILKGVFAATMEAMPFRVLIYYPNRQIAVYPVEWQVDFHQALIPINQIHKHVALSLQQLKVRLAKLVQAEKLNSLGDAFGLFPPEKIQAMFSEACAFWAQHNVPVATTDYSPKTLSKTDETAYVALAETLRKQLTAHYEYGDE